MSGLDYLNNIGEDPGISSAVEDFANGFAEAIRANLVAKDSWYEESNLYASIGIQSIETTTDGWIVKIGMPFYAKFIDKGRRPGGKPGSIAYALSGNGSGAAGNWVARRGIQPPMMIKIKKKNNRGGIKTYVRKFTSKIEANRSLSFAIASSISKHGYKANGHGFLSEMKESDIIKKLSYKLSLALGEWVTASL